MTNDQKLSTFFSYPLPKLSTVPPKKWYFVTKIVLTYYEKNCSSDREKLLKFEAEGREFARSGQFLVTECFFNSFMEKIRTIRIQIGKNY